MEQREDISVRPGFFPRPRVEEILKQALQYPLVTLFAGSGYGKRKSVAQYLAGQDVNVIWLQAARSENMAAQFWDGFLAAFAQGDDVAASQASALAFPVVREDWDAFQQALATYAGTGRRLAMVIEGYEHVRDENMHRFIVNVASLRLGYFCIVLIGQNHNVPALRALADADLLYKITADDLKYTAGEVAELLDYYGVSYTSDELTNFCRRTEGWPMAVNDLARHYSQNPQGDGLGTRGFSGYFQFFCRDYYAAYPAEVQRLLLKLALLPIFSAEMIAGMDAPPVREMLAILDANPYVNYDPMTGTYGFHSMYRDFLCDRKSELTDGEIDAVYSVAGDWFDRNGLLFEAVACFEKCKRYDDMYNSITSLALERRERVLADFVLDYLGRLPEEYVRKNPLVLCTRAAMLLNNFEVDQGEEMIQRLREEYEAKAPTPENRAFLGELYIMLSDYCYIRNNDEMHACYQKAAECLPNGSVFRDEKLMLLDNNSVFFLRNGAAGELDHMVRAFAEGMPVGAKVMQGCGCGLEHLFAAEAAYCTGDMAGAKTEAYRAIYKAQEKNQHDIICNAHYLLMCASLYSDNYEETMDRLDHLRQYVGNHSNTALFTLRDCAQGWLYLKLADPDRIPKWLTDAQQSATKGPPLEVGRPRLVRAGYLLKQQRYHELLALLEQMEGLYAKRGLWLARLSTYILKAICHMKMEQNALALEAFAQAYEMSWQNNIITPFVENGSDMRTLVEMVRRQEAHGFNVAWLDAVHQKSSTYAKRLSAMAGEHKRATSGTPVAQVGLTAREVEVLQALAQGLTRDEIGYHLHISVNTVKSVIKSIYNKMNAVNRADAVHMAGLMGLIS